MTEIFGARTRLKDAQLFVTGQLLSFHPYGTTHIDFRNAVFTYPVKGGVVSRHWRDVVLGRDITEPFKSEFASLLKQSLGDSVQCEFDGELEFGPPKNEGRIANPVIRVKRVIIGVKAFSKV